MLPLLRPVVNVQIAVVCACPVVCLTPAHRSLCRLLCGVFLPCGLPEAHTSAKSCAGGHRPGEGLQWVHPVGMHPRAGGAGSAARQQGGCCLLVLHWARTACGGVDLQVQCQGRPLHLLLVQHPRLPGRPVLAQCSNHAVLQVLAHLSVRGHAAAQREASR